MLPRLLDNLFIDGGEVVSYTCRPPFILMNLPGTPFCLRLSRPQGLSAAGWIKLNEKIHFIETLISDLPVYSIVHQPTTLPRAPKLSDGQGIINRQRWGSRGPSLILR
jgi:hypothetical protein